VSLVLSVQVVTVQYVMALVVPLVLSAMVHPVLSVQVGIV
jgi:hypothetical protein